VAAPPGGEEDKAGPRLIEAYPANGSTQVPPGNEVRLKFNEYIVKPQSGRAVFISPRPEDEPKIKWGSDHITIKFAEPFRQNTTYNVSVSSDITDLRNNRLDSSLAIAFSTGLLLDPGRLGGRIVAASGDAQSGMLVGLYNEDQLNDSIAYDSVFPAYLTQANADGRFSFEYLPERTYRLIAFKEVLKNERFNPAREVFAVPDRPIDVAGELTLDSLRLTLNTGVADTSLPEIVAATYTPNAMLRIRLSRAIPLVFLSAGPAGMLLLEDGDSTRARGSKAFLERGREESSSITAWFGPLDSGRYDLRLNWIDRGPALVFESIEVAPSVDEAPPSVDLFEPDGGTHFVDDIAIRAVFSEPLDTSAMTGATVTLLDADGETTPLALRWTDPLTLHMVPESLVGGKTYRVVLTEFELTDLSGNVLGDTLREYRFSTYDPEDLGSVSGSVAITVPGHEDDPVMLSLKRVDGNGSLAQPVFGKRFSIEAPAGKYFLEGFADADSNGVRGLGSVSPYRFAEPSARFPDTITVRSRFETSGISFQIR